mmetsp:Transcript_19308/g.36072  ORF Transcript_19308/g.36072 Transcript_19308/m.36072 type:complete len:303 (-) Transcript_19308:87-995(-)
MGQIPPQLTPMAFHIALPRHHCSNSNNARRAALARLRQSHSQSDAQSRHQRYQHAHKRPLLLPAEAVQDSLDALLLLREDLVLGQRLDVHGLEHGNALVGGQLGRKDVRRRHGTSWTSVADSSSVHHERSARQNPSVGHAGGRGRHGVRSRHQTSRDCRRDLSDAQRPADHGLLALVSSWASSYARGPQIAAVHELGRGAKLTPALTPPVSLVFLLGIQRRLLGLLVLGLVREVVVLVGVVGPVDPSRLVDVAVVVVFVVVAGGPSILVDDVLLDADDVAAALLDLAPPQLVARHGGSSCSG